LLKTKTNYGFAAYLKHVWTNNYVCKCIIWDRKNQKYDKNQKLNMITENDTDKSGEIFVNDTTIERARVFSDTLLNSCSARICLISYLCRVWKLRSGMFEWTVNENDSTLCRVKLGKKLAPPVELTEYGERGERLNAREWKRGNLQSSFASQSAAKIFWYSMNNCG